VGLGALLGVRVLMLWLLGDATNGVDFADDPQWQRLYVDDPWMILLGHRLDHAYDRFIHVYPPLLPVLIGIPGALLRPLLSDFHLLRAVYVLYELAAWPFLFSLVTAHSMSARVRRIVLATYVVLPIAWMTSVVMSQEEMIGFFLMTVTFALLARGRRSAAIVVCALGVVAAKIFFLVPLVPLVLGLRWDSWRALGKRAAIAAAPIALVYAIPATLWIVRGEGFPLGGFTAKVEDSTSVWSLLQFLPATRDVFVGTLKKLSMIAALLTGFLPLVLARLRRDEDEPARLARAMVARLLWVYVAFYQIQPEYFLLVVPGLIVVLRPTVAAALNFGLFSLAWSVNVFYGIRMADESGAAGGKALFTAWYHQWIPIAPSVLQQVAVAAFAIGTVALAVTLSRRSASVLR
jgi:hypothetical protein